MKNMKSSHLSGLIKKSGLAIIATAFVLTASIAQADFKPAVVYDIAGKNDKSFNESVFNGATRFMNDTGIAVTELEPTNEPQRAQTLKKLAQRGYEPIVAVGFVGGMDIPLISRFECGYKQGVAYQDSSVNVSHFSFCTLLSY